MGPALPRRGRLDRILTAPDRLEVLARASVACVVTKAEASRVDRQPAHLGWGRYLAEGVRVHDMLVFEEVAVQELVRKMPAP